MPYSANNNFIPPFFKDFHKKAKDLLTKTVKGDDFNNKVVVKHKTTNGVEVETTGVLGDNITGQFTANYTNNGNKFSVKDTTTGVFNAEVALKELADGLVVTVGLDQSEKLNGGLPTVGVKADYFSDYFSISSKIAAFKGAESISASFDGAAAVGYEDFSVGGKFTFDPSSQVFTNTDVGAQYAANDFVVDLQTLDSGKQINAGFFQKVNDDLDIAINVNFAICADADSKSVSTITLAQNYKVDAQTKVKVVANTAGSVLVGVEHFVQKPNVLVNAAASFDVKGDAKFVAQKFGLKFTLDN